MTAVQAERFDVLLIDADSFALEGTKLLQQVLALYPVTALSLTRHHVWLGSGRAPNGGFSGSLHKPLTAASVIDALWHLPARPGDVSSAESTDGSDTHAAGPQLQS